MELHSKKFNLIEFHVIKLHLPNFCFFVSIKFNARNIIFNQKPIVIKEINSNSNKNFKNCYHQYNINAAGTIFIFIFIFGRM